jgi:hypothetical protein
MSKSYRLRTNIGVDRQINVQLEQDFEQIEILSLKVRSEDVYTRMCADYGVVVGRVFSNGGYGIPNARVSIFVPLTEEDSNNEIIRDLYPYSEITDVNEDGYRYNLLPYEKSHGGHIPTGTFPSKKDILTNPALIEVFDKYYKYTVKTNGSGDFMIMGVPVGTHTLVMDLDLSDMGPFSMGPQDLIRIGLTTSDQIDGPEFQRSSDLSTLPQIVSLSQSVEVEPFWGQPEICQVGIARHDFNLSEVGVSIQPTALFMGSLISNNDDKAVSLGCRPPTEMGDLCNLTTNSGEILGVRQTIFQDSDGLPIIEVAQLPQGGKVIDEAGAWLLEVPMNLDFVTTNEFGEQILSNDPSVGVPTKGKYRFKIKYGQPSSIELNSTRRGYFLVPNVKEYGWIVSQTDPIYSVNINSVAYKKLKSSYYFGLDWSGYTNGFTTQNEIQSRTQEIVNCEDTFYEFIYNKVYTVSGLVDQYSKGLSRGNFIGIKEITDSTCSSENNQFPATDAVRNFDLNFFIINLLLTIFAPLGLVLIPILNFLAQFWPVMRWVLVYFISSWLGYNAVIYAYNAVMALISPVPQIALAASLAVQSVIWGAGLTFFLVKAAPIFTRFNFKDFKLPMISYPDCEACECGDQDLLLPEITGNPFVGNNATTTQVGNYILYTTSGVSPLFPSFNQSTWGELVGDVNDTEPVGINPDDYSGNSNKRNQKYTADITGFRYGMSGMNYVLPPQNQDDSNINKLANTPLTISYTTDKIRVGPDITLSQSMNLMNIRERYFENLNIIQTTVNNPSNPSQPFTDNVLILLVPENSWTNGDILTFNDTESINDPNFTGNTLNQFGTTSITGTTSSGVVTKTVTYIQPNGVVGTSTVYLNSSDTSQAYQFPTGVEYCQIITQFNASFVDNALNTGSGSLLEKYLFDKNQKIRYVDSDGNDKDVTLNSLKSIGESWKDYYVVFLVRGVDVYTESQVIKYDLNKLFGYSFGSNSNLIIEGSYKPNIPIQPNSGSGSWFTNFKSPESHLTNYSTSTVFHAPYNFVVDQNEYQSVFTDKLSYYSALDKSTISFIPNVGDQPVSNFVNNSYLNNGSLSDSGKNTQIIRFFGTQYQGVIEGGTFIAGSETTTNLPTIPNVRVYSPAYFQPGVNQPPTAVHNISYDTNIGNVKLVLRSDRLPTSDLTIGINPLSNSRMVLFQNPRFSVFIVESTGQSSISVNVGGSVSFFEPTLGFGLDNNLDRVISSFGCSGMVPLGCYSSDDNGQLTVLDPCPANENPVRVSDGCYDLVEPDDRGSYLRNIPQLVNNYLEWIQRFRVMFAACRGVFSHVFVNSWVNGSLFAYPFRNRPEFSPSGDLITRKVVFNPISSSQQVDYSFCSDLLYFDDDTNNFYYRSSPYNNFSKRFIGKKAATTVGTPFGIYEGPAQDILNSYNLQYPTTILDLGPKYFWTKDLVLQSDYYGYTIDKIPNTTWNEISNLFQTFVISRLINTNFWNLVLGTGNASINGFFSRNKDRVDGDYAQMLQINSQYGVKPFNEGNYVDDPAIPGDNPIYISKDLQGNPIFGLFYDSFTSDRDIISPRRIDRTFTGLNLVADYLGTKSQEVPFYLWKNNAYNASFSQIIGGCVCEEYEIDNTANSLSDTVSYQNCNSGQLETTTVLANQTITICACQASITTNIATINLQGPCTPPPSIGAENSIFGNQFNSWYTVPNQPIFSSKYQSLDRLNSPYFIGDNGQIQNRLGYIFQKNALGEYVPQNLGGYNLATLTSGPWYFYFGLRQGASAIDKFREIYIRTDE